VRFIGISGQDNTDEMARFVDEYGVGGFDHVADLNGEIWSVFGVSAQPSYVFINDNGEIRRHIGGLQAEDLAAELDLLIAS